MAKKSLSNKTEETILMVAKNVFLNKGYKMTTTTEIANQAGVTHAMLHYYYRTKDNLFSKVFEHYAKIMLDSFSLFLKEDLSFTEKITFGIEAHFDFIAANPKLPYFIVSELINDNNFIKLSINKLLPSLKNIFNQLEISIQEEANAGRIRYISAQDLIYDIICLNAFAFIALPTLKNNNCISEEDYAKFIARRKAENVQTILNRIAIK